MDAVKKRAVRDERSEAVGAGERARPACWRSRPDFANFRGASNAGRARYHHTRRTKFVADTAERIGTCTLRGINHPPKFPVLLATTADTLRLTGQVQFELDRTACGSHYGSGKLFRFLGPHFVNDHRHLHVKIQAIRTAD